MSPNERVTVIIGDVNKRRPFLWLDIGEIPFESLMIYYLYMEE